MVTINVIKPFRLNLGGDMHEFAAGVQEVDADVAGHWYVSAHSEQVAEKAAAEEDRQKPKKK